MLHAEIRDVKLEVSTDRTLASAEAYAYHESFVARSPELYQPATLARIQSGANISASTALRASRDLQASRHAIRKIFDEVDVLLTPTVPIPPPVIADLRAHPDNLRPQELIMLRNTRPFNVWGIPAISDSLRIHKRWPADRPATSRRSLAGGRGAAGGTCLRAGDGVAHAERQMYQFSREPDHCTYPLTLSP